MGIHDRDYARERSTLSRGGSPGSRRAVGILRMWSANTWLIMLCILMFVADSFMPKSTWVHVRVGDDLPTFAHYDTTGRFAEWKPDDPQIDQAFQSVWTDTLAEDKTAPIGVAYYAPMPPLWRWMHFSTSLGFLGMEFWRFIGFQFIHASMGHLLFNMLGLYFFGEMVERKLGSKRYLAFYLLCGICGALMYLLLNLGGIVVSLLSNDSVHVPGLLFNSPNTPLLGASAGVFGVLMAGAYLAPREVVLLFFVIPMRLQTLAYALVAIALFTVITGGGNAGGEAGHLGGAIAGFYFIRRSHHLHNFFDILGRVDPTSHHYRESRRAKRASLVDGAEVDRILAKVHQHGLASLTEREKRLLKDASRGGS